ncbi:pilus assembly protein N-terminal domain-containing protein [Aureimonas mangrovi]|uniref:pilus assembly protein N-terminal domain-containing protein n=1 Tax=Aureimonas mangrovi TaxID=2758041 RepID=UPI00163D76C5|nr:pilus assembly protein N-terminal domain-containing protein [Aureimonas mangrovi]
MIRTALAALLLTASVQANPAFAQDAALSVSIDHAKVLKIDRAAETIIVGNPSIVDVTVHDAHTLVLTGRSYGVTNLVVLDAQGDAVIDEAVSVGSVETASVRVYRQAQRSTYSCSPHCEPTVTIGDSDSAFGAAAGQFGVRESLARNAAQ